MSKGLLIKGGKIVNADRTFNADIYCEDGVIKRIAPSIEKESVVPDARVIDARGKIIIPGEHRSETRFRIFSSLLLFNLFKYSKISLLTIHRILI